MFPERVLVTGAAGFMGTRLCEALHMTHACQVRAFLHSAGSAARVARLPVDFVLGDLCNARDVERAMDGVDAVVHLARGSTQVMRTGLENLLRAALRHRISRFVHMSSVAVYGNDPPPHSSSESAPTRRTDLPYGNEKLGQERRVRRYAARGLPAVILRPPNVYGPFSHFNLGLLDKIRSESLAIVDSGRNPCNLVYVDNLIEMVLLALWKQEAVGQTFFVTDSNPVTWDKCLSDHAAILGCSLPRVSVTDLVPPARERLLRDSLRILPGVVFSKDFRGALRRVPFIFKLEQFIHERFESLPARTKQAIRLRVHGPERRDAPSKPRFHATDNIIAAQARKVAHSNEKARTLLGYSAIVSYEEGMTLTREWLRACQIVS
jgi:nucleoside-diphosphate-sugar epimerase